MVLGETKTGSKGVNASAFCSLVGNTLICAHVRYNVSLLSCLGVKLAQPSD